MSEPTPPTSLPRSPKDIFARAIELPSQQRAAFLEQQCGNDPSLRSALEALLAADQGAGAFFAAPTVLDSTTVQESLGPDLPDRLGPYKLLQPLGEGGFGTVYMAEQESPVRRRVALKLIKLGMDTQQVIARFEAERQALAIMDHPNIARVIDAGATPTGRPYFVMELVKGVPITDYCDANKLTPRQRVELMIPVCQAIQHAHQKGIIHRDIKPSNVLVTLHDGRPVPKVIDFGVAKAIGQRLTEKTYFTEFRQMVGTPEYMSPEQAEMSGLDVDTRTDVYSLGVVIYQLLTGLTPFEPRELRSKAYAEMQRIIREVDPPKPSTRVSASENLPSIAANRGVDPKQLTSSVSGELDWIVMKCLEKDRSRRYESASALAADVMRYLADEPVQAGPVSTSYRVKKLIRRHRVPVIAGAAVVTALIAGIIGTTLGLLEARRQRDEARRQTDEARRQRAQAEQANQNTQAVNDFLTTDLLAHANPLISQGKELTIRQVLDRASETVATKLADRPLVEAAVRYTLSITYDSLGRVDLALPHAQASFDIRKKNLGDEHPDTLRSLCKLAVVLQNMGRLREAEPLYRQAVETGRRVLGPDDTFLLRWSCDYARTLQDLGRLDEAEILCRDVLARRRRVLGEEHQDTLTSMHMLGSVLLHLQRYDEAEGLFRQDLEKRRRVLGELSPDTILSIADTATLLHRQDKFDQAEPLYREALAKWIQVLGPNHPNTLITTQSLAICLESLGKPEEAIAILSDAVVRASQALGDGDSITIRARLNLGSQYFMQGRTAEAEASLRKALDDCALAIGPDHPLTLTLLFRLGDLLAKQSRWAEAEVLARREMQATLRLNGTQHPYTVKTTQKLAEVLSQLGRTEEAAALLSGLPATAHSSRPSTGPGR
jgi:serine/threonine protein kinase/tetratricopeptide (TPR) repeat protein